MYFKSTKLTPRLVIIASLMVTTIPAGAASPSVHRAAMPLPASIAAVDNDSSEKLLKAVTEGSVENLTAALEAGGNINGHDRDGKTGLMLAASAGRTDLVQMLLEKGADSNARDKEGRTALHYVLAAAAAPEPQKKTGGFGGLLRKAKEVGGKAVGALAGANPYLASLLPGGPLLQNLARGMMSRGLPGLLAPGSYFSPGSSDAWSGVLGAALLNTGSKGKDAPGALLGALEGLETGTGSAAAWSTLFSTASEKQPDLIKAVSNVAADAAPEERAAWAAFIKAADAGDTETLQSLLSNPSLSPLLEKASSGLRSAIQMLPGRDGGAGIIAALLSHGADINIAAKDGLTALQRAQNRKLDTVARLLAQQTAAQNPQ